MAALAATGCRRDETTNDSPPTPCPVSYTERTLDSHVLVLRYLATDKGAAVFRELAADTPLDLSTRMGARWMDFTESGSTTLLSDLSSIGDGYAAARDALLAGFSMAELAESLTIIPCHDDGTVAGTQQSAQSRCDVSPVLPAAQDDYRAFVQAAASEFLRVRKTTGPFVVSFGGAEMPRQIWPTQNGTPPDTSFWRHPREYLELARTTWQAAQDVAGSTEVWLRLPGFMTLPLELMHYEDSHADSLQIAYSDGQADVVLSKTEVDEEIANVFGAPFSTGELDPGQQDAILATACSSDDSVCKLVQATVWSRRILQEIPQVFGQDPSTPLIIDMHLYGGDYAHQLDLAGPESVVRTALDGYPAIRFVVVEQGSPYSSLPPTSFADMTAVYQELARDLPKSVLSLLAAGISRVPTRPPVSEEDAWPTFGHYALTDTHGDNPRPAYFATKPLLELIGAGTEGATLAHGRLGPIEIFEVRPVGGDPTFVLWSDDGSTYRLTLQTDGTGIEVLESAISATETVPTLQCAGQDSCALNVGPTAIYVTGPATLDLVADATTGDCVLPE